MQYETLESINGMEKFNEKIYEDGITWLFGHHCLECGHLTFAQREVKDLAKYFYELGCHQAEKDCLENKHKKSWRLNEKLWKGVKIKIEYILYVLLALCIITMVWAICSMP